MRWLRRGLAAVAAMGLAALLGGMSLDQSHRATRTVTLRASPTEVFAVVSDFAGYPEWRTDVTRVEAVGATSAGARIVEHGPGGEIPYRVEVVEAPTRLVTRIDSTELEFGGTWTYELVPSDTGTRLTITEDGEVYHPIFRLVARFILGYHATMDQYLTDLKRRLGEP